MTFKSLRKDSEVLLYPVLLLENRKKRSKWQKRQLTLATQGQQEALRGSGGGEPAVILLDTWNGSDSITKGEKVASKAY